MSFGRSTFHLFTPISLLRFVGRRGIFFPSLFFGGEVRGSTRMYPLPGKVLACFLLLLLCRLYSPSGANRVLSSRCRRSISQFFSPPLVESFFLSPFLCILRFIFFVLTLALELQGRPPLSFYFQTVMVLFFFLDYFDRQSPPPFSRLNNFFLRPGTLVVCYWVR